MEPISAQFNEATLKRFVWLMMWFFFWISHANDADAAEKKRERRLREGQAGAEPKRVRRPASVPAPGFG